LSKTSNAGRPSAGDFDVFCGIDVARETHHAVALNQDGHRFGISALSLFAAAPDAQRGGSFRGESQVDRHGAGRADRVAVLE
jgi:hypothetical protein